MDVSCFVLKSNLIEKSKFSFLLKPSPLFILTSTFERFEARKGDR